MNLTTKFTKNLKSKVSKNFRTNKFIWVIFSLIITISLGYTLIANAQQSVPYIPQLGCEFDRPDFKFGETESPVLVDGVFKTPINYNLPQGFRSKLCDVLKPILPPDNSLYLGLYGGKIYDGYPLFRDEIAKYREDRDRNILLNLCSIVTRVPRLLPNSTEIDYLYEIGYNPELKGFWVPNTEQIDGNETYGQNNYIAWVNFFSKRYWLENTYKDRVDEDEMTILPMEYEALLQIKKKEKIEASDNQAQRDQKREELNFEIGRFRKEAEIYPEIVLDLNVEAFINEIKNYDCNSEDLYITLQRWSNYDRILADWTKKMYADDLINTVRRSSDILK
jgi:hypothetical protein